MAAYSVVRHPSKYSGMIGLSRAYFPHPDHAVSSVLVALLKMLKSFAPKLPLRQIFDPNLIVKDKGVLQKWYEDPLCSKDKIRLGYAVEATRCRDELPGLAGDIDIPMFMMIGSDDHVVSLEGLKMMTNYSKNANSKIKVYDGGYHNLLAEPTLKGEVVKDIKDWILRRIEFEVVDNNNTHVPQ